MTRSQISGVRGSSNGQVAVARRALRGKGADGVRVGHVQHGVAGLAAFGADGLGGAGGQAGVHVGDDDQGALPGKASRDGGAQAASGARDEDPLVLHLDHGFSLRACPKGECPNERLSTLRMLAVDSPRLRFAP
jgi:hypothetical protein